MIEVSQKDTAKPADISQAKSSQGKFNFASEDALEVLTLEAPKELSSRFTEANPFQGKIAYARGKAIHILAPTSAEYNKIQKLLGYKFKNLRYLYDALTLSSASGPGANTFNSMTRIGGAAAPAMLGRSLNKSKGFYLTHSTSWKTIENLWNSKLIKVLNAGSWQKMNNATANIFEKTLFSSLCGAAFLDGGLEAVQTLADGYEQKLSKSVSHKPEKLKEAQHYIADLKVLDPIINEALNPNLIENILENSHTYTLIKFGFLALRTLTLELAVDILEKQSNHIEASLYQFLTNPGSKRMMHNIAAHILKNAPTSIPKDSCKPTTRCICILGAIHLESGIDSIRSIFPVEFVKKPIGNFINRKLEKLKRKKRIYKFVNTKKQTSDLPKPKAQDKSEIINTSQQVLEVFFKLDKSDPKNVESFLENLKACKTKRTLFFSESILDTELAISHRLYKALRALMNGGFIARQESDNVEEISTLLGPYKKSKKRFGNFFIKNLEALPLSIENISSEKVFYICLSFLVAELGAEESLKKLYSLFQVNLHKEPDFTSGINKVASYILDCNPEFIDMLDITANFLSCDLKYKELSLLMLSPGKTSDVHLIKARTLFAEMGRLLLQEAFRETNPTSEVQDIDQIALERVKFLNNNTSSNQNCNNFLDFFDRNEKKVRKAVTISLGLLFFEESKTEARKFAKTFLTKTPGGSTIPTTKKDPFEINLTSCELIRANKTREVPTLTYAAEKFILDELDISPETIQDIISHDLTIEINTDTNRPQVKHYLFYSTKDDKYLVAIVDEIDSMIITIKTADLYNQQKGIGIFKSHEFLARRMIYAFDAYDRTEKQLAIQQLNIHTSIDFKSPKRAQINFTVSGQEFGHITELIASDPDYLSYFDETFSTEEIKDISSIQIRLGEDGIPVDISDLVLSKLSEPEERSDDQG